MKHWHVALALVVFGLLIGCTSPDPAQQGVNEAQQDIRQGRVADAKADLEILREDYPDDLEVRIELAEVYYQEARLALEANDQAEYLRLLGAAQEELIAAVAIDPAAAAPHTWMGIVAAYRGDLDTALQSFQNASHLAPVSGVSYTNIAHVWVYMGKLSSARTMLDKGRKLRAPQDEIDRIEILAAWRGKDFIEAKDVFDMALDNPVFADTWERLLRESIVWSEHGQRVPPGADRGGEARARGRHHPPGAPAGDGTPAQAPRDLRAPSRPGDHHRGPRVRHRVA